MSKYKEEFDYELEESLFELSQYSKDILLSIKYAPNIQSIPEEDRRSVEENLMQGALRFETLSERKTYTQDILQLAYQILNLIPQVIEKCSLRQKRMLENLSKSIQLFLLEIDKYQEYEQKYKYPQKYESKEKEEELTRDLSSKEAWELGFKQKLQEIEEKVSNPSKDAFKLGQIDAETYLYTLKIPDRQDQLSGRGKEAPVYDAAKSLMEDLEEKNKTSSYFSQKKKHELTKNEDLTSKKAPALRAADVLISRNKEDKEALEKLKKKAEIP